MFFPDGRLLAGCCQDQIWFWNTSTYALERASPRLDNIKALSISPDGQVLASAEGGRSVSRIRLWDVSTGTLQRTETLSTPIEALAFSPDSRLLASISADFEVRLSVVADTCSHTQPGSAVASSNSIKASGSMESHMLKNYWKFPCRCNRSHRTSLAFSADCTLLACLIADKIAVWDTGTKSLRQADLAPEASLYTGIFGRWVSSRDQHGVLQDSEWWR